MKNRFMIVGIIISIQLCWCLAEYQKERIARFLLLQPWQVQQGLTGPPMEPGQRHASIAPLASPRMGPTFMLRILVTIPFGRSSLPQEMVSIFAGSTSGYSGSDDGTGTAARFNSPSGITTDGTNLYVADYW